MTAPQDESSVFPAEQWESGDVVLAADGRLWQHADAKRGFVWDRLSTDGSVDSRVATYPQRPLALLVRDGQPVASAR